MRHVLEIENGLCNSAKSVFCINKCVMFTFAVKWQMGPFPQLFLKLQSCRLAGLQEWYRRL